MVTSRGNYMTRSHVPTFRFALVVTRVSKKDFKPACGQIKTSQTGYVVFRISKLTFFVEVSFFFVSLCAHIQVDSETRARWTGERLHFLAVNSLSCNPACRLRLLPSPLYSLLLSAWIFQSICFPLMSHSLLLTWKKDGLI